MQHNEINTCRLYNKWTVKVSVTNSIHVVVTVCKNVHCKGITKLIKSQYKIIKFAPLLSKEAKGWEKNIRKYKTVSYNYSSKRTMCTYMNIDNKL